MASNDVPIEAEWKISRVLQHYPQLLDTLIGVSPAFARLGNPVLRRVQARLVTVAQAAGIAGLEPGELVRRLNVAVGIADPDALGERQHGSAKPGAETRPSPPEWLAGAVVAEAHDIRPVIERGEEPFAAITAWARRVEVGHVLQLDVPFEPVPLYGALGKLGFDHWPVQLAPDHWRVAFYRQRAAAQRVDESISVDDGNWDGLADAEVTIDVSDLVPPEPMMRILEAMEMLPVGKSLLVHHVRRPVHLYPELEARGYDHATREPGSDHVEILIHKPAHGGAR